ncbi:hypothetical protein B0H34DRAFT_737686 [Crassisporium funariophilum]|nr:hypothetical protein B0H34DRAFT_737686 [Crassisporium funariophilum]
MSTAQMEGSAQLVEALERLQLVTFFVVAACSMFLWDYLITLGMEVELVWSSKWTSIKVLYIVQRYLPFIDMFYFTLQYQFGHNLSTTDCRRIASAVGYLYNVGFASSELLLALRAWAVWHHNRRLAVIMGVAYVLFWLPDFGYMYLFLRSVQFGTPPYPGFIGCWVTKGNPILAYCWLVLIVWDAFVLVLMAIPGIKTYMRTVHPNRLGTHETLQDIIYRDGLIFYIYLFILSTIQIIVIWTLPTDYILVLAGLERCSHSVLSSRVLLHIRAHVKEREQVIQYSLGELSVYQARSS